VTVTDAAGANSSVGYSLHVQNVNDRPVWVLTAADANLTEGSWLFIDVLAEDADAGDTIHYSISSEPASGIAVNPATGTIHWTNVTVGNYTVTVKATDGCYTIVTAFNITVNSIPVPPPPPPPPENNVPAIAAVSDRDGVEGVAMNVQLSGNDADKWDARNLTFRLVAPPAGAVISANGLLSWVPTTDQVGNHTITVSLSDGKNSTTTSFNVTVTKGTTITTTGGKTGNTGISMEITAGLAVVMLIIGLAVGALVFRASRKKP